MAKGPGRTAATVMVVNGFRRIMRALRVAAGETQSVVGISAAQVYVLRQLTGGEVLSITELARRTLTDRTSVAAVVEKLVGRGLIERSASREDRRRAEVRITAKGERLLNGAPPAPTTLLVTALQRLPSAELRVLAGAMNRLVTEMGLEDTAPSMLFEDEATK